jgi:hypothetical protein
MPLNDSLQIGVLPHGIRFLVGDSFQFYTLLLGGCQVMRIASKLASGASSSQHLIKYMWLCNICWQEQMHGRQVGTVQLQFLWWQM